MHKNMFGHCVGARMFFEGGALVWVLSFQSRYSLIKFLYITRRGGEKGHK